MSENRVTLRFSPDLMSALDGCSKSLYMTRCEFIRHCVQQQIALIDKQNADQFMQDRQRINMLEKQVRDLQLINTHLEDML